MNNGLYIRLAVQNIRKNKNTFYPFLLAGIAMTAMFYMLDSIRLQVNEELFFGANTMEKILVIGVAVAGIFSVCVLFYTDGFLMKQRGREFGLYSLLGMEKRHISGVVFWEMAIIGAIGTAIGLLSGILFSRLMFMVLLKILKLKTSFEFHIMPAAVIRTALIFAVVYAAAMLANTIRVYRLKPLELMRSTREGEREPKAKWLLAVIGAAMLSYGYYLSQTAENPLKAMTSFLKAVICVIAGTYLLFLAGSIACLKLLKRNKKFYYHKRHFITVSGMMYRMKQNAVGLANICILCTGVLVVLCSTVSLYVGIEDVIKNRYPTDVMIDFLYEKGEADDYSALNGGHYDYTVVTEAFYERARKYNVDIRDLKQYYNYTATCSLTGNQMISYVDASDYGSAATVYFIRVDDYNMLTGSNISLDKGHVLMYASNENYLGLNEFEINDRSYAIDGYFYDIPWIPTMIDVTDAFVVVVDSLDELKNIRTCVNDYYTEIYGDTGGVSNVEYNIDFNLSGSDGDKNSFCEGLRDYINNTGIAHLANVENIYTTKPEMYGIYGGLFFVGIFIGTLFLVTTVMIIYYKQLSEGYEDRERFAIMQKVGMSRSEVKAVIRSQVIQVFFLPIAMAVLHICFAFKIIKDLLVAMSFTNVALFLKCTVATVLVFSAVYFIVYLLTAGTYYRITAYEVDK